tara:strand:+ start:77 stop:421 length:345 start_codon:yes stop_codon:yes gene_type:complete
MTTKEINIAIAIACGWKVSTGFAGIGSMHHPTHCTCFDGPGCSVPDYLTDLNAMHEAEKMIPFISRQAYYENILFTVFKDPAGDGSHVEMWAVCHATAAQRAEAFLRTIGKWTD